MATVDTQTSHEAGEQPGGLLYDGFISYSHAADDLLAPRLQSGLQRFAKPWWKRRALRIFRDESSLSANPHLWSSITDALDQSDWFVLLLSPDAADSEWVNQEVEYWLEHKDPDRIIPVVTEGEFTWSETDIDLESSAAPPALYGAFSNEPRWVDLRFARSEEQLDLNNPRFSAAVADVASAIRQVPKEELESEEVRQHRRTVRTAWAASIALLLLTVTAVGAGLFAIDQLNEANDQRRLAEENATEAEEQRQIAEENASAEAAARLEADQQRTEAETQTAIAQARELTLEAEKALDADPELSAHLALTALASFRQTGEDPAQAESALRAAVEHDRVTFRVPGGDFVAVHPDGALLVTADGDNVAVWDIATGEVVERYERDGEWASGAAFSPDGNLLAVMFQSAEPAITIWDRTTGDSFTIGTFPGGFLPELVFSPNGELLAFRMENEVGVEVWSVTERRLVHQTNEGGNTPDFNADGLMSYAVDSDNCETCGSAVRVIDPASGRLVHTFPVDLDPLFFTQWSPDGTRIAAGNQETMVVLDGKTGAEVSRAENIGRVFRPEWLPSNDAFVVGGELIPRVVDASTGEVRLELRGQGEGIGVWDYDVVPGTTRLASAALGPADFVRAGDTVIFDTSELGGVEVGGWLLPLNPFRASFTVHGDRVVATGGWEGSYLTANAIDGSELRHVEGTPSPGWFLDVNPDGAFVFLAETEGDWTIRDTATDEVVYQARPGWSIHGVSDDGTKAVVNNECGPTQVVSTADGSVLSELSASNCVARAYFSPDGELVYAGGGIENGLYNPQTGELLVSFAGTEYGGFAAAFTPDGREFLVGTAHVYLFDLAKLLSGASIADAVRLEIAAHEALLLRMSVSPDGSMVATASWDEPYKLWNLDTGDLLGEFGGFVDGQLHDGDFHPSLPHLLVTTPPNEVRIHTLDIDELIAIAEAGLSRDMTEEECQQYFRRACDST